MSEQNVDRDAPMPIKRGAGVAAWRQIVDLLADEIQNGRLPPGGQLPTEARLAERYGVNRHTVRRAIAALAADGVLRATQGRGTFVEQSPLTYRIGSRTRFTENISRSGRHSGGEVIGADKLEAPDLIARRLGIATGTPILRMITRRFVDGTPVSLAQSHLPLPRFEGFDAKRRACGGMTEAFLAYGIQDYRRACSTISARPATVEEARLLDLAAGRVLLVVQNLDVDGAGQPIDAGRTLFSADRIELQVGDD